MAPAEFGPAAALAFIELVQPFRQSIAGGADIRGKFGDFIFDCTEPARPINGLILAAGRNMAESTIHTG